MNFISHLSQKEEKDLKWDLTLKGREKVDRYFVKVVVVNGKFWMAFPVYYNPITKWQQWKINPNPASAYSRFQGREVNLWLALDKTTGRKIQNQIFMCCKTELNIKILATQQYLLSQARDFNSTVEWEVILSETNSLTEKTVFILWWNTINMHWLRFDSSVHYEKCSPFVGADSGGGMWEFDTVKKYTLFVIFMGEGSKYKMEQNEDGQFDLYEQCTGDGCGCPKKHSEWHFLKVLPHLPWVCWPWWACIRSCWYNTWQIQKSEGYKSSANITSD